MEKYILFSWGDWFSILGIIVLLFLFLRVLIYLIPRFLKESVFRKSVLKLLESLFILYEPIAICLLVVSFFFIHPFIHGSFVALLAFFLYPVIKDYVGGRLLFLTSNLKLGQQIKTSSGKGFLQRKDRTNLLLKTKEGSQRIRYSALLKDGYSVLKEENTKSFYQLKIQFPDDDGQNRIKELKQGLLICPFLDWTYTPQIQRIEDHVYALRVQTYGKRHLDNLITLLKEEYQCKIKE